MPLWRIAWNIQAMYQNKRLMWHVTSGWWTHYRIRVIAGLVPGNVALRASRLTNVKIWNMTSTKIQEIAPTKIKSNVFEYLKKQQHTNKTKQSRIGIPLSLCLYKTIRRGRPGWGRWRGDKMSLSWTWRLIARGLSLDPRGLSHQYSEGCYAVGSKYISWHDSGLYKF